MEHIEQCLICGHTELVTAFEGFDRYLDVRESFRILRCRFCGNGFTSPRPDRHEIGRYYRDYGLHDLSFSPVYPGYHFRKFLPKPPAKLLDIGCGAGRLLAGLKEMGYSVEGLDISREAADNARKAFGIHVHVGMIDELDLPEERYDAVTMSNYLEHVHDPLSTLKAVNRVMKYGGIAIAGSPNFRCITRRLLAEYWPALHLPCHLIHFNPRGYTEVFKNSGFEVIGRWDSINSRPLAAALHKMAYERFGFRLPSVRFLKRILMPAMFIAGRVHRSTLMGIAARKKAVSK